MIVAPEFSQLKNGPERRRGSGASRRPRMSTDGRADRALDPTELRFVGPATAATIDRAPFEAADVLDRAVSYSDLLAAGVNPGVAAKLRREYSLVWSFDWVAGANLERRADLVSGLDAEQRAWIASSESTGDASDGTERDVIDAERAWRERAVGSTTDEPTSCERCGDRLVTFRLGDRRSVQCEACGFVGVAVRS